MRKVCNSVRLGLAFHVFQHICDGCTANFGVQLVTVSGFVIILNILIVLQYVDLGLCKGLLERLFDFVMCIDFVELSIFSSYGTPGARSVKVPGLLIATHVKDVLDLFS